MAEAGAERFVLTITRMVVNPTNVMGITASIGIRPFAGLIPRGPCRPALRQQLKCILFCSE